MKLIFIIIVASIFIQANYSLAQNNSITLFNKSVQFGSSQDEFKAIFDQFSIDPNDNNTYTYRTNYDNAFDNYWINVNFTNNKLSCLELNGWQTNEYMAILKSVLNQLIYDKTVKEQNEDVGTIETVYYHKDDLNAEYFAFETSVLKICLK